MPFKHAHWWILAIFPVAALAFWPNYVSKLADSPPSFHLHGITASMWLLLLAIQSWSIHTGRRAFHRTNGLVSFALFPLFMAGGAAIFIGMAERFVEAASPFHALYAPRLAWLDFVAILGLAFFYFQALRYRRFVGKHSAYMLATATFLLPPVFGRLAPLAMGLDPTSPTFFANMKMGFQYANVLAAAVAFLIGWRAGRNGRPFMIAGALTLISSILFEYPGGAAWWWAVYPQFADIPVPVLAGTAAIMGAVVGWAGWKAGKTSPIAA